MDDAMTISADDREIIDARHPVAVESRERLQVMNFAVITGRGTVRLRK
jgi:hypothetical protein